MSQTLYQGKVNNEHIKKHMASILKDLSYNLVAALYNCAHKTR